MDSFSNKTNLSLYGAYLQERSKDCILENEKGFATYRFINNGKSVYIIDIYVVPDYRRERVAADMADEIARIAREWGCTEMLGSVCPAANNSTTSLKVLLGYGMTLQSASDNFIVFRKEL